MTARLIWQPRDPSHIGTECRAFTITRAPATTHAKPGCTIVYSLWKGKKSIAHLRCNNTEAERLATVNQLKDLAEQHCAP